MSRGPTSAALLAWALLAAGSATGAAAAPRQQAEPLRLVAFTNEPREPEFGQVFELRLSLRLAPGVVAFIPDTLLPAENAVSAGRGRWSATPGPADSLDVQATYFVMGLLNGGVELPYLEVFTRPATGGEPGGARPASELDALPPAERAFLEQTVLEIGGALILVPAEMAGREAAIEPRPPADVLGGEWSPWLIAALAASALAVALLAWLLVPRQPAAADSLGAPGPHPRTEALRELDRILALGWHADGRVADFYDATTGVLRRLCELREADWRTALTSTELVRRIEERWGAPAVARLRVAIWAAECAKFGARRPAPEAAEDDWRAVRDWIGGLPED